MKMKSETQVTTPVYRQVGWAVEVTVHFRGSNGKFQCASIFCQGATPSVARAAAMAEKRYQEAFVDTLAVSVNDKAVKVTAPVKIKHYNSQ